MTQTDIYDLIIPGYIEKAKEAREAGYRIEFKDETIRITAKHDPKWGVRLEKREIRELINRLPREINNSNVETILDVILAKSLEWQQ